MAKSFFSGLVPVDQVDGLGDLARLDLHRHAVAQQAVDGLVVAVERAVVVVRLGAQLVQRDADLRRGVAAPGQPGGEQPFLDVAVAVAVGPVAEVAVAQLVAEQGDDAVLRGAFGLADGAHTSRILSGEQFLHHRPCLTRGASALCTLRAHRATITASMAQPALAFQRFGHRPFENLRTLASYHVLRHDRLQSVAAASIQAVSPRGARPAA